MGCDIHAHVELKLADGQWHHWNAPSIARHYALFTKLAGVRNYGEETPFAEPRGLPVDVTLPTRNARDYDGPDGHSDSWISRDEIRQLEEWWNEKVRSQPSQPKYDPRSVFEVGVMGGYLSGNGYGHELPEWVTDVRLVFWFDN